VGDAEPDALARKTSGGNVVVGTLPDVLSYVIDPVDLAPELREVKDYWNKKRGARDMPRRADVDPAELRRHLPFLFLIDVLDDARDFRFRLLGTEITDMLQRNSTGKTVREVYAHAEPEIMHWMLEVYGMAVTRKSPVLRRGTLGIVRKEFIAFESLHLPLSDDGEHVNMLFGRSRYLATAPKVDAREKRRSPSRRETK
jgi:hypothetical protein